MADKRPHRFDSESLVTPIYIDTNVLLDVLASMEDGFSVVEKLTSFSGHSREADQNVRASGGTEFGIPNVLSLLKINIGGSVASKRAEEMGHQRESERYHTYGSLLYRVREMLAQHGIIKRFDGTPTSWRASKLPISWSCAGPFGPTLLLSL